MIYSQDFLKKLSQQKNRMIYARVVALTWDELPIESIEGSLTGGSINIDGASAVRRTCSLTMVTENKNVSNNYWGINTKFKLEIGIYNQTDSNYPEIIWFKQGIFIITSFSQALGVNSNTINIQGKDKMCLLNGEVSGSLETQIDFGKIEQVDADGNITVISYPIKDIIRQAVHQYAGEPYHNIVINDLDIMGLELREYRGNESLYFIKEENSGVYNGPIKSDTEVQIVANNETISSLISNLPVYDSLSQLLIPDNVTKFKIDSDAIYTCLKISYGQTVGYTETELTYAGELIANVGENLTSILDKIVKMLNNFEYFYDLDGQFIFQKKQDYLNLSTFTSDGGVQPLALQSYINFIFEDNNLINSLNNNINLLNVKNDYSVWGTRRISGSEASIHMRYAIDVKPKQYKSITVTENDKTAIDAYNSKYNTTVGYQTGILYNNNVDDPENGYDWREIIYQMAMDYYKYNFLDDFEIKVAAANPNLYPLGITGYEQYYIDLQGFWRHLYMPNIIEEKEKYDIIKTQLDYEEANLKQLKESLKVAQTTDEVEQLEIQIKQAKEKIQELENSWSKRPFNLEDFYIDGKYLGWNRNIFEDSTSLNFWFDFLESDGEIGKFSVKNIGTRQKVVNNSEIRAISYDATPNIILTFDGSIGTQTGYTYININNLSLKEAFVMSSQGTSAQETINSLLYNHSYCVENASITAIPVYFLQPNTRIYLNDIASGLVGEYSVDRVSIPLTYNGTMNITATKIIKQIL